MTIIVTKTEAMCMINRANGLTGIQHEKKIRKSRKNSSVYFDSKMMEEEEIGQQMDEAG